MSRRSAGCSWGCLQRGVRDEAFLGASTRCATLRALVAKRVLGDVRCHRCGQSIHCGSLGASRAFENGSRPVPGRARVHQQRGHVLKLFALAKGVWKRRSERARPPRQQCPRAMGWQGRPPRRRPTPLRAPRAIGRCRSRASAAGCCFQRTGVRNPGDRRHRSGCADRDPETRARRT